MTDRPPQEQTGGEPVHKPDDNEPLQEYGGGFIKERHGKVNAWLMVVYLILLAWAVYYVIKYWGGLGPGLDY